MIGPYYAAPTSYDLYEGFDSNGWAIGSHGKESDKNHGVGIKFQGYSPVPGQPCPIDLCNCQ